MALERAHHFDSQAARLCFDLLRTPAGHVVGRPPSDFPWVRQPSAWDLADLSPTTLGPCVVLVEPALRGAVGVDVEPRGPAAFSVRGGQAELLRREVEKRAGGRWDRARAFLASADRLYWEHALRFAPLLSRLGADADLRQEGWLALYRGCMRLDPSAHAGEQGAYLRTRLRGLRAPCAFPTPKGELDLTVPSPACMDAERRLMAREELQATVERVLGPADRRLLMESVGGVEASDLHDTCRALGRAKLRIRRFG